MPRPVGINQWCLEKEGSSVTRGGTSRTVAVASAVVAAVLVVLTAVAATTVTSIRDSQREVERLSAVVTVWRDLQLAVSEEAFAEAGYRRAPSEDARERLDRAAAAVPARVAAAREVGDARDSATLSQVTVLNERYVAEVRRTLDDPPAASGEDPVAGPALDAMSDALADAVLGHRERATQARADQAERTGRMLWLVPSGTFLGAVALAACWWTLVRKHRRLAASAAVSAVRAAQDALTGLANREAFRAAFDLRVEDDQPCALLVVDLDHFKEVNDSLGHQAGDALLVAVADHLRAIVRAGDVVGRLGGDEFAVLLASPAGAERVCEQVVLAVADLAVAYDVGIGASVGTACWPVDGDTYAELVHTADVRMYAAKREGRGRTQRDALPAPAQGPAPATTPSLVG